MGSNMERVSTDKVQGKKEEGIGKMARDSGGPMNTTELN